MGFSALLLGLSLTGTPAPTVSEPPPSRAAVPCQSVKDCWLDDEGRAIRRPARYRGRHLPKGDCGAHLRWLRHALTCEEGVCTSRDVGDRC